ncbi:auxin efflux carrier component 2-like [Abrus precatorius]|uniref:Auxin efflux carrier component n=1 Tax=Abrus precatorius TaxID=3816 RepID=A0A8B8LE76_ABRPR|nr:auxin efflux carrier component 2-like [Abrus precatorius]
MIKGKDIYEVLATLVPLYVAFTLAYGSVRWWKIFTPEQCSGINRFVAVFAVPFLSFHYISSNNLYTMNFRFVAADTLQKVGILVGLFLWNTFTKWGSIDWTITFFSLSTLPNTLIMGIPLLKAMYGDFTASLMVQIVVLQSGVWSTFLLFMFEYRAAKKLILEQFPESAGAITSLRVDSNVSSLNGKEPLQADAEIVENGNLHVVVRNLSRSMSMFSSFNKSHSISTPRASNLTGVEIYSAQSCREPTLRASSFSGTNFNTTSLKSVGFEEEKLKMDRNKFWRSKSCSNEVYKGGLVSHPSLKPMFPGSYSVGQSSEDMRGGATNKELHMFAWSLINASPNSDVQHAANGVSSANFGTIEPSKAVDAPQEPDSSKAVNELIDRNPSPNGNRERKLEIEERMLGSPKEMNIEESNENKKQQMPSAIVMTRLILIMVWRNIIRNPNTYANVLGLAWSLMSFKLNIKLPSIVQGSISILSNTGLGMAMFSLGLFMALQPKIITCGKTRAAISMAIRFLIGPGVMAATSKLMSIRGALLQVAIVQAALPEGVVPFVFAKEYNLHADILSTAVIFGMIIALPVTIIYYVLLGL